MQVVQLVNVSAGLKMKLKAGTNILAARLDSPQIHLLSIDFVFIEIKEIDCAGHALIPIFLALHYATIVQKALQKSGD